MKALLISDGPPLGQCCACWRCDQVQYLVLVARRLPPGDSGWGCTMCGATMAGAMACLCRACWASGSRPTRAIASGRGSFLRHQLADCVGRHQHDPACPFAGTIWFPDESFAPGPDTPSLAVGADRIGRGP